MSETAIPVPAALSPTRVNRSSEELAMRDILVPKMRAFWPDARIVHELPLRYSKRRIDLAAITPEHIVSVEIKSSRDVIDRLEGQLRGFAPVSGALICAVAPKWSEPLTGADVVSGRRDRFRAHRTEIDRIVASLDVPCPIWTVDAATSAVTNSYKPVRMTTPWPTHMLSLLHVGELMEIAAIHRVHSGRTIPHYDLVERCAELMTGREIGRSVCRALRARNAFDKASDPPIDPGPARIRVE